jgi:hypothetical protein
LSRSRVKEILEDDDDEDSMEKAPLEEGEPKNRNFIVNYVGESL